MTDHIVYVIIPAAPGFEVLEYFHNNGGDDAVIDRHPVVAWRVDPEDGSDYAEPITPEGMSTRSRCAIKYPDGSVNRPADRTWPTEARWLADMAVQGEQRKRA